MLRLLGRYVFREILTSAVMGTLLATFVIFLRHADTLFGVLVGATNVTPRIVFSLFAWAIPPVLPMTIPFGVLVGILIGLGRMSSDGEITAMRAAGVSSRKVIAPVLLFAAIGLGLAGYASLRLTPLSINKNTQLINELLATQLTADVEPRVFLENFPNKILYVGDVQPGPQVARWRPLFIADVTPPEQRTTGMKDKADGPLVTVAKEALAVSDPKHNRILLSMTGVSTHEMGKDHVSNDSTAARSQQALDASPARQESLPTRAMSTSELLRPHNWRGPNWKEVQIEFHWRLATPIACIVLAMVGIPLGIATRKGGKSAGYIVALFLGFLCYYLSSVTLIGIAKQKSLPVPLAVWLPDAVFFAVGLVFLFRMELPGDRDILGALKNLGDRIKALYKPRADRTAGTGRPSGWRLPLLPQIVDTYILSNFLFYLLVWLASLVSMFLIYNFFELMGDMFRNSTLSRMFTYLFFLTPDLVYKTLPICVLLGVLVQLGVLSKQNEITAFKASGVSLYRLAAPILVGAMLFSGVLFAFDYSVVPTANLKQNALRDEIKGKAQQTWLRPDRKWIMGHGSRIYYYRYFDTQEKVMNEVYVFELEPKTFRLEREVIAARALWSPSLKTWIFENGWSSDFTSDTDRTTKVWQTATFPELTEPPDYFLTAPVQSEQMSFLELDKYIHDLTQRGITTTKLQVQFYRKFAMPLFALIMAMIAIPFGFLVGNRGAMAGIGVSLVIAIAYLAINPLFEELGNVNLLPAAMAAWSPDLVFALVGMYFMLRMRS